LGFATFKAFLSRKLLNEGNLNLTLFKKICLGGIMAKFMYEGSRNPGNGSRLPLGKKLKKWAYNIKVSLTRNQDEEVSSVGKVRRALK